jgi:hypothetical protein
LEEWQTLLCLQDIDLEVQEEMQVEEQPCGLHPFDKKDLPMEFEGIHTRVDGIESESAIEAGQLS